MHRDPKNLPRTRLLRIMLVVNAVNSAGWSVFLFLRYAGGIDERFISGMTSGLGALLALVGLAMSYNRYGRYSGWILVLTSLVSTLVAALSIEPDRAALAFYFLIGPVGVAALLISSRAGIGTFAAAFTAEVAVTWFRDDVSWEHALPSAGLLGYISAILIVATYVKERLEREHKAELAESAKMASLGLMSAGIAHEINNPLFVLSVSASRLEELVLEEHLDRERLIDIARKVATMTQRIEQTSKGLKNFAREASADPFHETAVKDVLTQTRELCRHRFAEGQVALTFTDLPPGLSCCCRPVQVSQVLVNLLNNAFDAVQGSTEKCVRVEVEDRGERVAFAVVDSGPGVAPEHRQRIMNPFFTTKTEGKGTGLGLSLSLAIARDHGGRVYLDETSSSTRFVLELPKIPQVRPPNAH